MTSPTARIAYLTAGAGGMYCGSCLHDNTLVRAMTALGADIQLIPLYTPIRTDEQNVSIDRVFYSGISIYLHVRAPWTRWIPGLDLLCNQPWLLRWAASGNIATDPRQLGLLTIAMLRGWHGPLRKEVQQLVEWLATAATPDLIVLSNLLIGGCLPALKKRLNCPVVVTLQGDDVFLEGLPEPFRSQALAELRQLVPYVDGFITHSGYYADFMSQYLGIAPQRMTVVPLGIDTTDFHCFLQDRSAAGNQRPPTIGYLARLAPEKGLHVLVDAFLELQQRQGLATSRLLIAGWLGKEHESYAQQQFDKLRAAGLSDQFTYLGAVDRQQKLDFLSRIDILSVPTTYREPKGLFVLESLAAGVPVVQPDHGAFPELIGALGGGLLVPPQDPTQLAENLAQLLKDDAARRALGRAGQAAVHERFHATAMARATMDAFQEVIERQKAKTKGKKK